jgi:hypothetical protein
MSFLAPLALLALLALPGLWWLLRATPPQPANTLFPPLRLLLNLTNEDETPVQTPWWLLALRLALVTLIILAFAGPVWRAATPINIAGGGPMLIVMDTDWASAGDWETRTAQAERLIEAADAQGRAVSILGVPQPLLAPPLPGDDEQALALLDGLLPQPVPSDRQETLGTLETLLDSSSWADASLVWLTNGLAFDDALRSALADLPVTMVHGSAPDLALTLDGGADGPAALVSALSQPASDAQLVAFDSAGRELARSTLRDETGQLLDRVTFERPLDIRNDIARIALLPTHHAGHVLLVDDRLERRRVGIVGGERADEAQPLLSGTTYVERALSPFSDVVIPRTGDTNAEIADMIASDVDVIVLVGVASLIPSSITLLEPWIERGGVLVRFASTSLAQNSDDLIPVPLRRSDRQLGGALTWEEPQAIAPFSADSPFAGLTVPDDVRIERQILSEPGAALATATYAELADATPLVTGQARGDGQLVLFHLTADTGWSNLPLSGLFVDMLQRLVEMSRLSSDNAATTQTATPGTGDNTFAPRALLDGFGTLGSPPAHAEGLVIRGGQVPEPGIGNPPGFYGSADNARALNLFAEIPDLQAADPARSAEMASMDVPLDEAIALRPALITLAVLLALADAVIVLVLSGAVHGVGRTRTASVLLAGLALTVVTPEPGRTQEQSDIARLIASANVTRIAYVETGDTQLDQRSRQGLDGLSRILTQRTAFEPGAPMAIDPVRDELAFFPLIYWPMPESTIAVSDALVTRIDAYMNNGGTILFDTRDEAASFSFGAGGSISPQTRNLRTLLEALDIPPLEPVPDDHVLTKSFYLLDSFPGRYPSGPLWVEALPEVDGPASDRPARGGDGVSPIMITGNDFASAWALSADGRPLYATSPPDPVQREFAFRTGINIAMYIMTGNYKADQVHIPALLERLVQ